LVRAPGSVERWYGRWGPRRAGCGAGVRGARVAAPGSAAARDAQFGEVRQLLTRSNIFAVRSSVLALSLGSSSAWCRRK
jgi:hypothetical protein